MNTIVSALLLIASIHLPARADDRCDSILTGKQIKALRNANEYGNSYEILTREFDGRTKAVALVGEKTHQNGLSTMVGIPLYRAFDRTAFSFRRKMDLDDKFFGQLAAPILKAIFTMHAYFNPEERAEIDKLQPHIDAYFRNPKPVVELDPELKPFTNHKALVNNASYEVHPEEVLRLARMDIQEFLDEASADPAGRRTVNLERALQPNWRDWMRSRMFSINAGVTAAVFAAPLISPESIHSPLAAVWLAALTWQAAGIATHGYNARPWYRYVFPFIYVGDGRRNQAAVLSILSTVALKAANNIVVVVEQRRLSDLRDRLIRLGFTSVDAKPAKDRLAYRSKYLR